VQSIQAICAGHVFSCSCLRRVYRRALDARASTPRMVKVASDVARVLHKRSKNLAAQKRKAENEAARAARLAVLTEDEKLRALRKREAEKEKRRLLKECRVRREARDQAAREALAARIDAERTRADERRKLEDAEARRRAAAAIKKSANPKEGRAAPPSSARFVGRAESDASNPTRNEPVDPLLYFRAADESADDWTDVDEEEPEPSCASKRARAVLVAREERRLGAGPRELEVEAQCCVVRADTLGYGRWDDEMPCSGSDSAAPAEWSESVRRLGAYFVRCRESVLAGKCPASNWWRPNEDASARPCSKVVWGTFNAVFFLNDSASDYFQLPAVVSRGGGRVPLSRVVIRLTRPDLFDPAKGSSAPGHSRYERSATQARELWHGLHAALCGFGPTCYAALLFLATYEGSAPLYGVLTVMERCEHTLAEHMDAAIAKVRARPSVQLKGELSRAGAAFAKETLKLLVLQARRGGINLDAKPNNYVVARGGQLFAIDFDVAMHGFAGFHAPTSGADAWQPNLFVNLLLLTCHVRVAYDESFARGWADCIRPALLRASKSAARASWLLRAIARKECVRPAGDAFEGEENATLALEHIVHHYFVTLRVHHQHPMWLLHGIRAPVLVVQLLCFALCGSVQQVGGDCDADVAAAVTVLSLASSKYSRSL
jgi:hypothetical protein